MMIDCFFSLTDLREYIKIFLFDFKKIMTQENYFDLIDVIEDLWKLNYETDIVYLIERIQNIIFQK